MVQEDSKHAKLKFNILFLALICSIFLTQLDQTIVSTALPTIATELNGFANMSWVFTIYMLASTAMMPIAGKLSDLYGRKLFLIIGLSLFITASILCGLAGSMEQLIVYRAMKGIGAGFLMPITFTVLFSVMPKGNNIYQTIYMGVFALSSIVGPTIGALLTGMLGWRYIFFINIPFGVIVFFVFIKLLQRKSDSAKPTHSIGYLAPLLLVTGTLSLLMFLKLGGVSWNWSSIQSISLIFVGISATVLFIRHQLKAKEPVIPFQLFKNRVICATYISTIVQGIILYGALVYIPLFVQVSLGGNIAYTGGALTPLMLCVMFGATLCGILIQRSTWRLTIFTAMLLCFTACTLILTLPTEPSFIYICFIMMILGLGIGMMMMVGQTAISMSVDESIRGAATSSVSFFRSIGGVLGTAIITSIITLRMTALLASNTTNLPGLGDQIGTITDPLSILEANSQLPLVQYELLQHLLGDSVKLGFLFLMIMALLGMISAFWAGNARHVEEDTTVKAGKVDVVSA